MDRTAMGTLRSRAIAEVSKHGGYVVGRSKSRPVIYAIPPEKGTSWPVITVPQIKRGVREIMQVSRVYGCTVIWQGSSQVPCTDSSPK